MDNDYRKVKNKIKKEIKKKHTLSVSKLISGDNYETFQNKTRRNFVYASFSFLLGVGYILVLSALFLAYKI